MALRVSPIVLTHLFRATVLLPPAIPVLLPSRALMSNSLMFLSRRMPYGLRHGTMEYLVILSFFRGIADWPFRLGTVVGSQDFKSAVKLTLTTWVKRFGAPQQLGTLSTLYRVCRERDLCVLVSRRTGRSSLLRPVQICLGEDYVILEWSQPCFDPCLHE